MYGPHRYESLRQDLGRCRPVSGRTSIHSVRNRAKVKPSAGLSVERLCRGHVRHSGDRASGVTASDLLLGIVAINLGCVIALAQLRA